MCMSELSDEDHNSRSSSQQLEQFFFSILQHLEVWQDLKRTGMSSGLCNEIPDRGHHFPCLLDVELLSKPSKYNPQKENTNTSKHNLKPK